MTNSLDKLTLLLAKKETKQWSHRLFQIKTLRSFLTEYKQEIHNSGWFGADYDVIEEPNKNVSGYEIYCLVDNLSEKKHTMNAEKKKKMKKAGKQRRLKLRYKYHYQNPMNRIHAYIIVQKNPGVTTNTLAVNVLCSSNYSDARGSGRYLLQSVIDCAKVVGFESIVLEVGCDEMEEKQHDEYELSEDSDDEDYDSDEDYGSDEDYTIDDCCEEISNELWIKSVRHRGPQKVPYYSFGDEYIHTILEEYFKNDSDKGPLPDIYKNDEEYGYGGYYYRKCKQRSKPLIHYYESFGFKESPLVNTEWRCFSELSFPSYVLYL
jgi:hypothetical protein